MASQQKTEPEVDKEAQKPERALTQQEQQENMIEIAVKFLHNIESKNVPDSQKRTFLQQKGLSDKEIETVFATYLKEKQELIAQQNAKPEETATAKISQKDDAPDLPQQSVEQRLQKAKESNFLTLKSSQITEIPEAALKLTNLTTLILSINPLQTIPAALESLKELKVLHLSSCNLYDKSLPEAIWKLQNLVDLNLAQNYLTNIDGVVNLEKISQLDVSDNELLALPENIEKLTSLRILIINNNNISAFPETLPALQLLNVLQIAGNSFSQEIQNALKTKGLKHFLSNFNELNF